MPTQVPPIHQRPVQLPVVPSLIALAQEGDLDASAWVERMAQRTDVREVEEACEVFAQRLCGSPTTQAAREAMLHAWVDCVMAVPSPSRAVMSACLRGFLRAIETDDEDALRRAMRVLLDCIVAERPIDPQRSESLDALRGAALLALTPAFAGSPVSAAAIGELLAEVLPVPRPEGEDEEEPDALIYDPANLVVWRCMSRAVLSEDSSQAMQNALFGGIVGILRANQPGRCAADFVRGFLQSLSGAQAHAVTDGSLDLMLGVLADGQPSDAATEQSMLHALASVDRDRIQDPADLARLLAAMGRRQDGAARLLSTIAEATRSVHAALWQTEAMNIAVALREQPPVVAQLTLVEQIVLGFGTEVSDAESKLPPPDDRVLGVWAGAVPMDMGLHVLRLARAYLDGAPVSQHTLDLHIARLVRAYGHVVQAQLATARSAEASAKFEADVLEPALGTLALRLASELDALAQLETFQWVPVEAQLRAQLRDVLGLQEALRSRTER